MSCTGEVPFIQANNARTFVFDLATEKLIFGEALKMDEHERSVGDGWHLRSLHVVLVESGLRMGEALKIR